MHEHKGGGRGGEGEIKERKKKIKYVQIEWVTTLPDLLVYYSILFYSMTMLKTH